MKEFIRKIKLDLLWFTLDKKNQFDFTLLSSKRVFLLFFFKYIFTSSSLRSIFLIRLSLFFVKKSKFISFFFFKTPSLIYNINLSKDISIAGGLRLPHPIDQINLIMNGLY